MLLDIRYSILGIAKFLCYLLWNCPLFNFDINLAVVTLKVVNCEIIKFFYQQYADFIIGKLQRQFCFCFSISLAEIF